MTVLAAIVLLIAPSLPIWGFYNEPHTQEKNLPLTAGNSLGQSFLWEHNRLDTIALFLDPAVSWANNEGGLQLILNKDDKPIAEAILQFQDIPASGAAVFSFDKPISASINSEGTWLVKLIDTDKPVNFKYQIDATKYADGELIFPHPSKQGDLAFQLRYQRPALGSWVKQIGYAFMLIISGIIVALALSQNIKKTYFQKKQLVIALALGLLVAIFYGTLLLRSGFWVGPSDFTKDASYVQASVSALRSGEWPTWSHITCGGMALTGNPEGNTWSLTTLIGFLTDPENALWLTLSLEAGLAAAGTFLLAQTLGLSLLGSVLAAAIFSLSPTFSYRLAEGFTMLGAVTYIPWVLLGYFRAKSKNNHWIILGGLAMAAMVLRGDVHVVAGLAFVMFLMAICEYIKTRNKQVLIILFSIGALSLIAASPKLVAYLEQPKLISNDVKPYVATLISDRLIDDVLLKIEDRSVGVRVLHGKLPERYGNFGSYVGLLPLLLGGLGLVIAIRKKSALAIGLFASFILAEGTFFELVLRHQAPLDAIFRVPSRQFAIFVIFLALLSGLAMDNIKLALASWRLKFIPIIIVIFIVLNLGWATYIILNDNLWLRTSTQLAKPEQPMLAPHLNFSSQDTRHASTLLRSGFLLPHICGDQNNPPAFLQSITNQDKNIYDSQIKTKPNSLDLTTPAGPQDLFIRERFTSSWQASEGVVLPATNGSIRLIIPEEHKDNTVLDYKSPTKRVQQLLLGLAGILFIFVIVFRR